MNAFIVVGIVISILAIACLVLYIIYRRKHSKQASSEEYEEMKGAAATAWLQDYAYDNLYYFTTDILFMGKMGGESAYRDTKGNFTNGGSFFHEACERLASMVGKGAILKAFNEINNCEVYIILMDHTRGLILDVAKNLYGNFQATEFFIKSLKDTYDTYVQSRGGKPGQSWSDRTNKGLSKNINPAFVVAHLMVAICECLGHSVIYQMMINEVKKLNNNVDPKSVISRMSHSGNTVADNSKVANDTPEEYGWHNDCEVCVVKHEHMKTPKDFRKKFITNVLNRIENCFAPVLRGLGINGVGIKFERNDNFNNDAVGWMKTEENIKKKIDNLNSYGIYEMRFVPLNKFVPHPFLLREELAIKVTDEQLDAIAAKDKAFAQKILDLQFSYLQKNGRTPPTVQRVQGKREVKPVTFFDNSPSSSHAVAKGFAQTRY